jgi:multidrug efflux pump subunit AcrB
MSAQSGGRGVAAYGIPIPSVRQALVRQNANVPRGNITTPLREQSLRTIGQVTDPKEFNDLVIATVNGFPFASGTSAGLRMASRNPAL